MFARMSCDPIREGLPVGGGLANHRKHIADFPGVLDVVAVVSNPRRYRSRYDLYRAFERHMHDSGVRLTTVELAFGERPWEITKPDNPRHVQLRTNFELWHKENLINLGVQHLPCDWKYVAWIDADVTFVRPDWAQETLHVLQHHPVIQLWSQAHDLNSNHEVIGTFRSFASCYREHADSGGPSVKALSRSCAMGYPGPDPPYTTRGYWHPGFAWAMRRDAWNTVGGLIDWAPLGSADFYTAWAIIGELEGHLYQDVADAVRAKRGFTPAYVNSLMDWQDRAAALRKDIGFVSGTILHSWHGPKSRRGYNSRENILIDTQFDPALDLRKDWAGVYQLSNRSIVLRDRIRAYFQQRDEDAPWSS